MSSHTRQNDFLPFTGRHGPIRGCLYLWCALHKFHHGSPHQDSICFSEFIFSKVRPNERFVCFPPAHQFGYSFVCRSWFVSRDLHMLWSSLGLRARFLNKIARISRHEIPEPMHKKQNKSKSNGGRGRERAKEATNFVALLGFFSLEVGVRWRVACLPRRKLKKLDY